MVKMGHELITNGFESHFSLSEIVESILKPPFVMADFRFKLHLMLLTI